MRYDVNQMPEQAARDKIDERLRACGWRIQGKGELDFNAGLGIAVREYQTSIGPADYVLFVDRQAVGIIEAKPDSWGARLTSVEEQSVGYANAKLKWVTLNESL
ncbi:MAG: type III restriction endonuclease subunit R, partial [Halomonas sp.]